MQFETVELDCKSVLDVKFGVFLLHLRALQETRGMIYITSLNIYENLIKVT